MRNATKRDDRNQTGIERGAGERTPRSGGRIVAQRTARRGFGTPATARDTRARGTREYLTQGSAALQPQERVDDVKNAPTSRMWDSVAQPDRGERFDHSTDQESAAGSGRGARATGAQLKAAPPLPVTVPRAPFAALILVLVVGGVLGILLVNTKINENAFRLSTLQERQADLDLRQQQLEKELTEAKTPNNLAAAARKLGLVESGSLAFIRLPDGQVIGIPQPAGGQPAITSQQGTGG